MANWANPLLTSTYVNFVTEVKGRDDDAARQFDPANTSATNVPNGTIRWNSNNSNWERWNGSAWAALSASYAISITGNAATATLATNATTAATTTGNAGTATTLQTARTINGTSFNGSANITTANWGTSRTITIGATGKAVNGSANVSWTVAEIGAVPSTGATGSANVPAGTTAQRDGSPLAGFFRFNTTLGKFEGYNGTAWGAVGGGATGGGSDAVFIENDRVVTASYTIPASKNAMTTGPITINDGVSITIADGARWVIL